MRLTKALGFAGALVLSALVGGAVIGSVFAVERPSGTDANEGDQPYCDTFMETLASELGVSRDALVEAGRTAALAAVDAAEEAGDLPAERAEEVRQRVENANGEGCGWFGPRVAGAYRHGMARGFMHGDLLEAAADALGLESADLIDELHDADSLSALAEEHGIAYDGVKASVLDAVQADLDAAVSEGVDTERADEIIERVTTWLDDGGPLGGVGPLGRLGPPGHRGR